MLGLSGRSLRITHAGVSELQCNISIHARLARTAHYERDSGLGNDSAKRCDRGYAIRPDHVHTGGPTLKVGLLAGMHVQPSPRDMDIGERKYRTPHKILPFGGRTLMIGGLWPTQYH